MLGARPSNPYGHFEDEEILAIHRRIMGQNGQTWQVTSPMPYSIGGADWEAMRGLAYRRNLEHPLWGFKDPRACFLLGAWKHLLPDLKVVAVFRDFGAASRSLSWRQARALLSEEGDPESHLRFWREPDHALRLWLAHNRALLSFVDAYPHDALVVPFAALERGYPVVRTIDERWSLGLNDVPTFAVFDPSAARERPTHERVLDSTTRRRVEETWAALEARSATAGP